MNRSRAIAFTVIALGGAVLSAQVTAAAEKKHKPEETAADLIAQFYSVKPDQVDVTILKQDANVATAITNSPGQPTCSLELALVSHSAANYDWLVGGISCDKVQSVQGNG